MFWKDPVLSYRLYTNVYSVILSFVKIIAVKDTLTSG